jgi:hypothetical protein
MILGKSGKSSDPPVNISLLHQIFTYSRRISQSRKDPKLGKMVLQGLNSMLYEKHHELKYPIAHLFYLILELGCGSGVVQSPPSQHLWEANPTMTISSNHGRHQRGPGHTRRRKRPYGL